MKHTFLLACALATALPYATGLSVQTERAAALPPTPIDAARLMAHVRVLASDEFEGRGPASAAEPKTVEYLIQQFKAAGVEPGGEADASGGRKWTQDVPLLQSEIAGSVTATLAVRGATRPLRQGEEIAIRATFHPVSRVWVSNAPLVFVGYGVSAPERKWDDFKGVDLRGRIAVVLVNDPDFEADLGGRFDGKAMTYYGRWTYKYEAAARRGALGVLVVHETAPASYGWETVKNSNTTAMFDIVRPDAAEVHPLVEAWIQRPVAVDLFKRVGLDFEAEKKKAQSDAFRPVPLDATLTIDYEVRQTRVVSRNVVALLRGTTRPGETVIYTAHWDHLGIGPPDAEGDRVYNGAVDNAVGTAALLELARVFAQAPRPERSVVFLAVTAEERGLLGSEYYARNPLYPLETTAGVLNMDGGAVYGPSRDVAIAGDGKISLQDDLIAAAKAQGRYFSPDPRPEAGSFFRSDHFSFAKVGVPAISFRAGRDLYDGGTKAGQTAFDAYNEKRYHQPGDEWSPDWDLRGVAIDTGLLYTVGRDLANSSRWPEWQPGSEFKALRDQTATARQGRIGSAAR